MARSCVIQKNAENLKKRDGENKKHEDLLAKWNKVNDRLKELRRIEYFYKKVCKYVKVNVVKIDFDILKSQMKDIQKLQMQYLNDKKSEKRKQQIAQEIEATENQKKDVQRL